MPCYFPLQAFFVLGDDGKKRITFSSGNARLFQLGYTSFGENALSLPCGRCMGCRLEKSRQWAVRCVHEAKLYDDNCFLTLTYAPEHLPKNGSLVKKHVQNFIKRLRKKFLDKRIRVFYCGEYGENFSRPHYHVILFNHTFADRVKEFKLNGFWHYRSAELSALWSFGRSALTDFSFETAAYVARYCTKKVSGSLADEHYRRFVPETGEEVRVLPEFCGMSLKPGIGYGWFAKYAKTDVFPNDSVISRGVECKLPRYYDVLWERQRPDEFALVKQSRVDSAKERVDDSSFARLAVRLKCQESRFKKLIRVMEVANG